MKNFIALFVILTSTAVWAAPIGTVMFLKGQATVKHDQKESPLKVTSSIYAGDEITTMAESKVRLVMNDRNIIVVVENTKMSFEEYRNVKKNKHVKINLDHGSLRHALQQKYKGKDEYYEVRTATAVAGVRGTDFITSLENETGDTVLCTLDGRVSFDLIKNGEPEKAPLFVDAGKFIRFKKGDSQAAVIEVKKPWLEKALKAHSLED